jgi:hypothetical protein
MNFFIFQYYVHKAITENEDCRMGDSPEKDQTKVLVMIPSNEESQSTNVYTNLKREIVRYFFKETGKMISVPSIKRYDGWFTVTALMSTSDWCCLRGACNIEQKDATTATDNLFEELRVVSGKLQSRLKLTEETIYREESSLYKNRILAERLKVAGAAINTLVGE